MPWTPAAFPRPIGAEATSGLTVTYTLVDDASGQCVLDGQRLDIAFVVSLPARCVVRAEQPGNAGWSPAPPVERTLVADVGGSRVVVVGEPAAVDAATWEVTVSEVNDVAEYLNVSATSGCSVSDPPSFTTVNVRLLITLTGPSCEVDVGGGGLAVWGGDRATVVIPPG